MAEPSKRKSFTPERCFPEPGWGNAAWLWLPAEPGSDLLMAVFARHVMAPGTRTARIWISAASHYILHCNGQIVGRGPARGDLEHYPFSEHAWELCPGTESELVWVVQVLAPGAFHATGDIRGRPGLLFHAVFRDSEGRETGRLASDPSWCCAVDTAFGRNACDDANWANTPMGATGYGERRDFGRTCDYLRLGSCAPLDWSPAVVIGARDGLDKQLVQRPSPPQEELCQALGVCFRPGETSPLPLPLALGAQSSRFFIDHGILTTGYPTFDFRGGEGRLVRVTYSELLIHADPVLARRAVDRESCRAVRCRSYQTSRSDSDVFPMAYYDEFILGPGTTHYTPTYLRTFRFLKIEIGPGPEAALETASHVFSAYPFKQRAWLRSSDPQLEQIANTAFHTLRLCAHDHFEDCPYYERLQYAGDTGLQALISYSVTGDAYLGQQAIRQLAWSHGPRHPQLTASCYPSSRPGEIPIFSLLWLRMAEDWLRFHDDERVIREIAPRMQEVVQFFETELRNGFIPDTGDNFVDWAWGHCLQGFRMPRSVDGSSCIVNLQAVWCLQSAARTFTRLDLPAAAQQAVCLAAQLQQAVLERGRHPSGLIADGPGLDTLSQHAQIWAILTDTVPLDEQTKLWEAVVNNPALVPTSIYQDYYAFLAADKLDRVADAWPRLDRWREFLSDGSTTFPEEDGRHGFIRSECHGWSAWVFVELLRLLLGIRVVAPDKVEVRPAYPPGITWAEGAMPLGKGFVHVSWCREGQSVRLGVTTSAGLKVQSGPGSGCA